MFAPKINIKISFTNACKNRYTISMSNMNGHHKLNISGMILFKYKFLMLYYYSFYWKEGKIGKIPNQKFHCDRQKRHHPHSWNRILLLRCHFESKFKTWTIVLIWIMTSLKIITLPQYSANSSASHNLSQSSRSYLLLAS
jgi:hypothetical protein